MQLQQVDTVENISPQDFKEKYYKPMKPLIIKNMAKNWPAYDKWNWDYFIDTVGDKEVGVYNNIKSDAYTPINTADAYMKFGDYLKKVKAGPLDLRIFLFNIFQHAPQLTTDFTWPDELMKGFVKKYPMLFVGGQGSITHMHFDIDMSHILHTQFIGRKRVLLFPFEEQYKLYRKPWEGGFAMSLRALQSSVGGKLTGLWKLFGMRNIDTLMKKTLPKWWYNRKREKLMKYAERELNAKNKS